jgi:hypothetical protein
MMLWSIFKAVWNNVFGILGTMLEHLFEHKGTTPGRIGT